MPQASPTPAPAPSQSWWPEAGAPLTPWCGTAAEAGEAAWHHNEAFEHLAARVECLNARLEAARTSLGGERPDLFDGVAGAFDGLKLAIGKLRAAWESDDPWLPRTQPGAALRQRAQITRADDAGEPGPWDAETAEALTRLCEIAAWEDHRRAARRRPAPPQPAPAAPRLPSARDLDGRLAELADRLQQALPRLDLAQCLAPIEARVRQLEQEVAATFPRAGRGQDANGLNGVETRLRELAGVVERTSSELRRLDDIEAHLREVIVQLTTLSTTASASAVAERAHATSNPSSKLEALLTSSLAARRQDARTAVVVLKSIQQAVGEIAERLEQRRNGERAADAVATGFESDPDSDRDLLLKAYREGARALGESLPEVGSETSGLTPGLRRPARHDWSASTWHWHADD